MNNKFMSVFQQQDWVNIAIDMTFYRKDNYSGDVEIYKYILEQLNYISACLNDKSLSREKLSDINIGYLAIREFESVDKEYSLCLKRVYFIVYYMSKGLKVPALDENGNVIRG